MTHIKSAGPPSGSDTEISYGFPATDRDQRSAPRRLTQPLVVEPPGPPFPYGRVQPDADLWVDRDGNVYRGDGPYRNRPLRRLRRAVSRWLR